MRQAFKETSEPSNGLKVKLEKSIIYEDNLILVINKPSGLAVHGGSGVSHGVIEILRASRPDAPFLELAHRLDRDTSGCLLLAKRRSALRITKRYLALLSGYVKRTAWRGDAPLRKNTLKSGERIVRVDPAGKPALTLFRVIQRFADTTLIEAVLETGRTHQIRVHAAHNGTPIVGDPKYGDEAVNHRFRAVGLRRLFLHAASLQFDWPEEGECLRVEAPLPSELQSALENLLAHE